MPILLLIQILLTYFLKLNSLNLLEKKGSAMCNVSGTGPDVSLTSAALPSSLGPDFVGPNIHAWLVLAREMDQKSYSTIDVCWWLVVVSSWKFSSLCPLSHRVLALRAILAPFNYPRQLLTEIYVRLIFYERKWRFFHHNTQWSSHHHFGCVFDFILIFLFFWNYFLIKFRSIKIST